MIQKIFKVILFAALVCLPFSAVKLLWSGHSLSANSSSPTDVLLAKYEHPLIPKSITNLRPDLVANNYILIDNATNTVLLSKNSDQHIYPASITKLATALTALNVYPLDELITVNQIYDDGQVMDLKLQETITVKSLVTALLVHSANDAAFNLASHYQSGVNGFVVEMNSLLTKYGLKNTHFTNYDGLHDPNHFSTVYDLSQLGRIAVKNSFIRDTVRNKKVVVTDVTGKISHDLSSTNELLDVVPEIYGLKTGWTPEAGGCFIALININGHEMISVVAQSDDRFADTAKIIEWAKKNVIWTPYRL